MTLSEQITQIRDEMQNYPHITSEFHSGDREPGTLAEGVARKKVDEWRDQLSALLKQLEAGDSAEPQTRPADPQPTPRLSPQFGSPHVRGRSR